MSKKKKDGYYENMSVGVAPSIGDTIDRISSSCLASLKVDCATDLASDCCVGTLTVSDNCATSVWNPITTTNELTITTTPNTGTYEFYPSTTDVLEWPVTGITINSSPISVDLSGIDWSDWFRLKSNRRRVTLKFNL